MDFITFTNMSTLEILSFNFFIMTIFIGIGFIFLFPNESIQFIIDIDE